MHQQIADIEEFEVGDFAAEPVAGCVWTRWGKPAIDCLGGIALLATALPVIAVAAALIKLTSRGPVFYSQTRLGLGGQSYRMHKLRTMPHDCEAATGPVWSTRGDPRVSRLGQFLRDTHLDELPQLWNVVTGDMSLIGPRPERPEFVEGLERMLPRYRERLAVRPGLTGLAQIQLGADINTGGVRRKLAYDLQYIHQLDLGLDVRIAVCTVLYMLGRLSTSLSNELVRSSRRAAELRVQSIEYIETEAVTIRTSGEAAVPEKVGGPS